MAMQCSMSNQFASYHIPSSNKFPCRLFFLLQFLFLKCHPECHPEYHPECHPECHPGPDMGPGPDHDNNICCCSVVLILVIWTWTIYISQVTKSKSFTVIVDNWTIDRPTPVAPLYIMQEADGCNALDDPWIRMGLKWKKMFIYQV